MSVAQTAGIPVHKQSLTPAEAAACDELFIAVTTKDIVPVTAFDGQPVGSGVCGTLTRKLISDFQEFVKTYSGG